MPTLARPQQGLRAPGEEPSDSTDRKVVRTIHLWPGVDEPSEIATRIGRLVDADGGYVSGLSFSNEGGRHFEVTLRVPADVANAVMAPLKGMANVVDRESLSSDDVTGQFIDLAARIRALEASEQELLSLLAESRARNHKVKDIVAIYEELTQIHSRIEHQQGRLKRLENQSAMATVTVRLRPIGLPKVPAVEQWQPLATLRESYRVLIGFVQSAIDFAIVLAVVFVPLGLAASAVLLAVARLAFRLSPSVRARAAQG